MKLSGAGLEFPRVREMAGTPLIKPNPMGENPPPDVAI